MGRPVDCRQGVTALHKAVGFLARREHSRKELRHKLAARNYGDKEIEQALQRLMEKGLQSDRRFAEACVRSWFERGHGPLKIAVQLEQKGIDAMQIEEVLNSGKFDWCGLAAGVYRKKFADKPPSDYREKARRSRFLRQRGFPDEQIQSAFSAFNTGLKGTLNESELP